MKRMLLSAFLLLCPATQFAIAQEFWETKNYKEWTAKECKRVQEDSPWAKRHTISQVVIEQIGSSTAFRAGEVTGRDSVTKIDYIVQLRSAVPVRKAVARCQVLESSAKLTPAQIKSFEDRLTTFAEGEYNDRIVINVRFTSENKLLEQNAAIYWAAMTTEKLRGKVYLSTARGGKVDPVDFFVEPTKGREFEIHFPRLANDNEPVVNANDTFLNLQLEMPGIGGSASFNQARGAANPLAGQGMTSSDTSATTEKAFIEFKPQKMLVRGKVAF